MKCQCTHCWNVVALASCKTWHWVIVSNIDCLEFLSATSTFVWSPLDDFFQWGIGLMQSDIKYILFARWPITFLPPASEGWGKVMFSVCSHLWEYSILAKVGTPRQSRHTPGQGRYTPWPRQVPLPAKVGTPRRTCYTAGGMPLAFMQGGLSCFLKYFLCKSLDF